MLTKKDISNKYGDRLLKNSIEKLHFRRVRGDNDLLKVRFNETFVTLL